MKFKSKGVRPEIFCGSVEDYEREPVRAIFDLLMFFDEEGRQVREFAYRPLDKIPDHILPFLIRRLRQFTDHKKPLGLEEAFGSRTGIQRKKLTAEQRNKRILSDIMWSEKRRFKDGDEKLTKQQLKAKNSLSTAEIAEFADRYRLSPEMIRQIAKSPWPGMKWSQSR